MEAKEKMKSYWFVFCKESLLVRMLSDGRAEVPVQETSPVTLAEWHVVREFSELDGLPCRVVQIDNPILPEGYELVGLRASYALLPLPVYLKAGKGAEILY